MVRIEVIQKRLQKLSEYLLILNALKEYSLEEFIKTPTLYGSCERFLHLSIEATLDIGNHLISDLNLGKVDRYRDIAEILCKKNYINEKLRDKWIKIIGFRNLLVHDYLETDHKTVYQILHNDLADLRQLAETFARFL